LNWEFQKELVGLNEFKTSAIFSGEAGVQQVLRLLATRLCDVGMFWDMGCAFYKDLGLVIR
jgi:hypothetical protein